MENGPDRRPGASVQGMLDNRIDQLRFLAVDDLLILMHLANDQLSVTAVAAKLSLTQPAVTQRIRKMEEVFKQKLIERKGRGIQLTHFGLEQAKRATAAVAALQNQEFPELTPDKTETTSQPEH